MHVHNAFADMTNVSPSRGSQTGGTYLTIQGSGLNDRTLTQPQVMIAGIYLHVFILISLLHCWWGLAGRFFPPPPSC